MSKTLMVTAFVNGGATTSAGATEYFHLSGHLIVDSTEANRDIKFQSAGTLSNLYARVQTNSTTAASTIRTRKNAGNGGQSKSIGAGATGEFEDTSGTDTIAAGDKLCIQTVTGTGGAINFREMSTIFDATTDTVTISGLTGLYTTTTASTSHFHNLQGYTADKATVETFTKCKMRKAGTLKNMGCYVSANRATTTTVRSRKNGANGNLAVSITGGGATGWYEDTSGSDTVSAAEDWDISVTTGTGSDTLTIQTIKTEFVSTNGDGFSFAGKNIGRAVADATTTYYSIGGNCDPTPTESVCQVTARAAFDISDFVVMVSQNGVTSASTCDVRVNAASSALSCSLTASTTGLFSDTSDTVTLAATDKINYRLVVPSVAGSQTITLTNIGTHTHITALTRISLSRIYKYNVLERVQSPSLLFDGIDDQVTLGNHSDLWSQALSKFSFSFWIYPTAGWDGGDRTTINHGGGSNHGFRCIIDSTNAGRIRFLIKNSVGSILTSTNETLVLNKWNHISCVYDNSLGSANLKIYVEKVVGTTTADLTETINLSATLVLADASADYKGNMKDFRFWSTKALTQTEINNIYDNLPSAPTPDYWLLCNEGTGTPTDSITGKTTTFQNGTIWQSKSPPVWTGLWQKLRYNLLGRVSLSRTYLWNLLSGLTRISLSRTYKYDVIGRISLARIYKYHVQKRISLSRIYKYHVIGRISLARIYKYNIIARTSLARIYKYHVQKRVSLSRVYKYHVAVRVSLARIYKYNILSRTSLVRIYKYHVQKRVSLARIYKYNIIGRISLSRVYKYHVQARISLSRVYKYHVAVRVSLARIYKYHVQKRVSLSRIYKYHIATRVSLQRIYKYHVLARRSLARVYKYHVLSRTSLVRTYKYNVIARVSLARIYLWNVVAEGLIRISLARTYKYHVATRVSLARVYKWHLVTRVSLSRIYKYHVLGRISLSRIYRYHVLQRISQARVYKYHVLARASLARVYKYNVIGRVSLQRIYKWNVVVIGLTRISLVRVYKYNVLSRTSLSRVYKYNVLSRLTLSRIYKYNMLGRVSLSRVYKWNVISLFRVSLSRVYKYNVIQRISKQSRLKWNLATLAVTQLGKVREWIYAKYSETNPSK